MSDEFDFRSCGGFAVIQAGDDPNDPASVGWNFGLLPTTPAVQADGGDSLYARFPNLQGRWDGKTSVNAHNAVRKVLGKDIESQYQRAGTCGGRASSRGLELLQCVMIAAGQRAKFKYVSHAWPYFLARREYNMLRGGDGVAGGSIPPMMAKYGMLTRDECGDTDYDSEQTDRLAQLWGGGRLSKTDEERFGLLASDNLVTAMVKCVSANECADALASGGIIIQSDSQGFSMERDSEGVCAPQGRWDHYHVRSGIRVTPRGRKVFDYNQSWGINNPRGTLLPGCPGNCFGVEWSVQDRTCKTGDVHAIFSFPLWNLENGKIDIPWIFE